MLDGAPAGGHGIHHWPGSIFSVEGGALRGRHGGWPVRRIAQWRRASAWPGRVDLAAGDTSVDHAGTAAAITAICGSTRALDVPLLMGSLSTNSRAHLGGFEGRALRAGDRLALRPAAAGCGPHDQAGPDGPIRIVWGLHADLFSSANPRSGSCRSDFTVSARLDRMGVRLDDPAKVFAGGTHPVAGVRRYRAGRYPDPG